MTGRREFFKRIAGDPAREAFEKRNSPEALAKFMTEQTAKARSMPGRKNKNKTNPTKRRDKRK